MARRLLIAFLLSVVTLAIMGWIVLSEPRGARPLGTALVVRDGRSTWLVQRATALGFSWWCAERGSVLSSPSPDIGEVPSRLNLLSRSSPRVGVLEVGWPQPVLVWRFESDGAQSIFPPSPEVSDEVSVLDDAWARAMNGEGDVALADGWALGPIALLAGALAGSFGLLRALNRRRAAGSRGT